MSPKRTLAALVLAFPLIASAAAPNQGRVDAKRAERGVIAQIRAYMFDLTAEPTSKRPAQRVHASRPTLGTKAIALNGLAHDTLGGTAALAALADKPLGR